MKNCCAVSNSYWMGVSHISEDKMLVIPFRRDTNFKEDMGVPKLKN